VNCPHDEAGGHREETEAVTIPAPFAGDDNLIGAISTTASADLIRKHNSQMAVGEYIDNNETRNTGSF
jgi:hypothetical protein